MIAAIAPIIADAAVMRAAQLWTPVLELPEPSTGFSGFI